MTGFRKALNQLRRSPSPSFSIRDQLRFLEDPPRRRTPARRDVRVEDSLPMGRTESNANGTHYVISNSYPHPHFHGKVLLDRLSSKDLEVLLDLARCKHAGLDRERIVFLDTETTGVSGGAGMCPFLIGVGFYRGDAFEVVQYFIRDFDEEPSMLLALGEFLKEFDLIVTYNGRSFDLPLVENRCVLSRLDSPFEHLSHFDLLFMARRLWRAGHGSCRLTALEEKLLRFVRGPDIAGSMIPQAYFDYLQSSDASILRSVFSHNIYDIQSLAALAISAADRVVTEPAALDDALDVYSLGRIFDTLRDRSKGIRCYELALESPMPAGVRIRTLERLSVLYRRIGEHVRSLGYCEQLMAQPEFSIIGYQGASIFFEHRAGDLESALKVVDEALVRMDGLPGMESRRARFQARRERIEKKLARKSRALVPSC